MIGARRDNNSARHAQLVLALVKWVLMGHTGGFLVTACATWVLVRAEEVVVTLEGPESSLPLGRHRSDVDLIRL